MRATNRITQDERPPLPNGHAAQRVAPRVNGHAHEAAPDESATNNSAPQVRAQAAADDAHGTPDAPASAPPAASANRAGDAAAACDSKKNVTEEDPPKRLTAHGAKSGRKNSGKNNAKNESAASHVPVPAGQLPLPEDAAAFVSAVHEQADIIEVGRRLLNSTDEKVVKGTWDRLVNLKFGNTDQASDANQEVINFDGAPRPIRNNPPQQGT